MSPETITVDAKAVEAKPAEQSEQPEKQLSNLEILNKAFEQKFMTVRSPNYSLLPDELLKAYVMLILGALTITPGGVRIDPDAPTQIAVLAGESSAASDDKAMEQIELMMDVMLVVRNSHDIYNMVKSMLEVINKAPVSDRLTGYMMDDTIAVAQMVTTSTIIGEHVSVFGHRLGMELDLESLKVQDLIKDDEKTQTTVAERPSDKPQTLDEKRLEANLDDSLVDLS